MLSFGKMTHQHKVPPNESHPSLAAAPKCHLETKPCLTVTTLRAYPSREPPPDVCPLLSWMPAPLLLGPWVKGAGSLSNTVHVRHLFKGHDFAAALLKSFEQVDL